MVRRINSFIWGGLAALALSIFGIVNFLNDNALPTLLIWIGLGVLAFTLISCLILNNNFVGDVIADIFSWGFVQMPNFIYSFDLDGLIWLLTVKLICWILGFTLAIACGILAVAVGLVVSLFVYPYAIYKNVAENRVHLTEEKKAEIAGSAE